MSDPALASSTDALGVYAVVVVYNEPYTSARCWPALREMHARAQRDSSGLHLKGALVYDNSPVAPHTAPPPPPWTDHVHDAANGGTGGAYSAGLAKAAAIGARWLLLLDQDTELPATLLELATQAMRSACTQGPEAHLLAIVPQVLHAGHIVSPMHLSRFGRIVPLPHQTPGVRLPPRSTAIASGALVKVSSFARLLPLPKGLWLDYVDHWLFRELQKAGALVASAAALTHDLSVATPRRISDARLRSMVTGEAIFMAGESALPRALFRLRLLTRGMLRPALSFAQRRLLVSSALSIGLCRERSASRRGTG